MKRMLLIIIALCSSAHILPMRIIRYLQTAYKPTYIPLPSKSISEKLNTRKCNNIIMILDPLHQDAQSRYDKSYNFNYFYKDLKENATALTLYTALNEQTAPILTTKNTMLYLCIAMTQQNDDPLNIKFTDSNWHCISHKNADLILLIPKNYIAKNMHTSSLAEQITSCGFKLDMSSLDVIKNLSIQNLLNYLNIATDNHVDIITAVKNLFFITKSDNDNYLSWNMYIVGHGFPSLSKIMLDEKLHKYPPMEQLQSNNEYYKIKNIRQYLKLLDEVKGFDDDTIIPDSGQIAGLMTNDFLDLISFFNENLKITFLHYTSCYSAGSNLAIIADSLTKLNVNFIVSCEGVTEQPVYAHSKATTPFTSFFFALCNFFNDPHQFITSLKKNNRLSSNPIGTILSTIVAPSGHALVRIPSIDGIFSPFSVDKKVKLLTNSMIKAYEFENKPIDCTNPDIQAIIIYSSYVGVPLKMNSRFECNIALALSQNVQSLTKRAVCVFEEINYPNSLSSFMYNLENRNITYTPITFVIKKLKHLKKGKPITIENMVFSIKGTRVLSPLGSFDTQTTCFFSDGNNNYFGASDSKLEHINFSPIEKTLSPELVSRVIDLQDMEGIAPEDITLPTIVEQLEEKTSKNFAVQHPGSLQKILERKIIESISTRLPGSVQILDEESQRIIRTAEENERKQSVEENRKQSAMKVEHE